MRITSVVVLLLVLVNSSDKLLKYAQNSQDSLNLFRFDDFEIFFGACRTASGGQGTFTTADRKTCMDDCAKDPNCKAFEIPVDPERNYCELHTEDIAKQTDSKLTLCVVKKKPEKPTYEEFGKSQCFTSNTRYPEDRADNPIFGGGGFDMVGTAAACETKCDHPNTVDSRGRRCVAFEHSSQDPYAVANCAFAWDCSGVRHWGGGKVYRKIYPAAGSLTCEATLNEWCASNTPYRYARFDRSHSSTTKQWRCYSTGALTADTFHVNTDNMPSSSTCTRGLSGGTLDPRDATCWNQWTRHSQLSRLLENCRQKPTYEVFGKSQCFTSNNALRPGDQADNPIFGGGGFNMVGNADACQTRCDDPNTIDSRGRRCVAFEHSSQDPNAVAKCAFAWDCSEIRHWGGGKVYRRTNVSSY